MASKTLPQLVKGATRRAGGARWPLAPSTRRIRVLLIAVAVVFSLCAGKALQIQAFDAHAYAAEAAEQMRKVRPLPAIRGAITDRFGDVLAYTEPTVMVFADPDMIRTNGKFDAPMTEADTRKAATAPATIAGILVRHLGGAPEDYLPQLIRPNSRYAIVAKKVPAGTFEAISKEMGEAKLIGLFKTPAPTRRYPNGTLASNLVGFVNEEGTASAGLELTLNKTLAGTDGKEIYDNSPNGKIPLGESVLIPAVNGTSYQTTIDAGLQWQMEQLLADRVRTAGDVSGVAIAMDTRTGEVLGMANHPTFDSNDPGKGKSADMGNRAITAAYEPGSVQKTLTFSAMLDTGLITPDTVITVPGQVKSGDHVIHDAWTHGPTKMTARGILTKSSNVGTLLLARKMPKATLANYLAAFGLGKKTKIGLPGEGTGSIPAQNMPEYQRDSVAFGMGLSVTAIQEAAAIAAIANGGVYNAPTVLKSVTTNDGVTKDIPRAEPRRVISAETAKQVSEMMEQVVAYSASQTFTVDGYRTTAKTGTAHRVDPKTHKYKGLYTSTIGFGPMEDPHILVYVVIETMNESSFGGSSAGPVFADIMRIALPRYGVPPSPTKTVKKPLYG